MGFVDETIRDGLQAPYCPALSAGEKINLIDFMAQIRGVTDVIIGMAGLGDKNHNELKEILTHCSKYQTSLTPWILCRSLQKDIAEVAGLMQATGCSLGINLFMCFSDIRIFVEGWDFNSIYQNLLHNVAICKKEFPKVRVAIEDATRTRRDVLGEVVLSLIELDVDRIVIADTAGVATPRGVERIFGYVKSIQKRFSNSKTAFEWHGHNDRGLAVANSLQSIFSGANYVHGTMMGIGERNGNAAIDTIIMNLSEYMYERINWEALIEYYRSYKHIFKEVVHRSYPYFGENSFTSSTGTHCAAIKKAISIGRIDLSRTLFSPPSRLSKSTDVVFLISHLSGKKNIEQALRQMGIQVEEDLLGHIAKFAKEHTGTLGREDILRVIEGRELKSGSYGS